MNSEEIIYPFYRKYVGVETWFKILNSKEFIEIKKVGARYIKSTIMATQYPEQLLIKDLFDCREGRWEEIQSEEFEALIDYL